jgi:hypothetical protein
MTGPWFWPGMPRRLRFRLDPHPLGSLVVWLHPDERTKPHPPVKPNRRRTHRRRK